MKPSLAAVAAIGGLAHAAGPSRETTDVAHFRPALIVVDMQNDFCLKTGSLSVGGALDIVPVINELLDLNFKLKVLTRDWHPDNHVSFSATHEGEGVTETTIANPRNASQTYTTPLWPKHCVQGTAGADFVSGLHVDRADACVSKGLNPTTEMFSAFYDRFHVDDSGLLGLLEAARVTHVYVVGVAADFCVKETAYDAVAEKFTTYVVQDATRAVFNGSDGRAWGQTRSEMKARGVGLVDMAGREVQSVRQRLGDGVAAVRGRPGCPR